ncbi:MAG: hypothetical protein KKF62_10975 [Bacteroidetes bacterium]|nr:hypothetical protein [Bacteroidota bacterium]MBU1115202.1 hypothetical protein [Bacteroidota bacterium]MBU1797833.1 hypothetical protein [Bacteroidota bacterium]
MKPKYHINLIKNYFLILPFVVLLILPICNNIFGQVVIKEKIKLEPKSNTPSKLNYASTSSTTHTFKINISWDETEKEAVLLALTTPPNSTIQDEGWVDGGESTLTAEFTKYGSFKIQVRSWDLREVDYTVTLDDKLVKSGTLQLLYASYGIPRHNEISYEILFYTGMEYDIYYDDCEDKTSIGYTAKKIVGHDIMWHKDEDLVTISISGVENITLTDYYREENYGKSISFNYQDGDDYYVIPTNRPTEGNVDITISAGNYSEKKSYYIQAEQYSLDAYLIKDKLCIGDLGQIYYYLNPRCGRWSPDLSPYKYTFEIIEGKEIVDLLNFNTNEKGDTITNVDYFNDRVLIIVNENSSENNSVIKFKVSANDETILPFEAEVLYVKPQLSVTLSPSNVSVGDTADVIIKKIEEDGSLTEFSDDQGFEVGLLNGCDYDYAEIINGYGMKNNYFIGYPQPFKLIITDEIPEDVKKIGLRVAVNRFVESTSSNKLSKLNIPQSDSTQRTNGFMQLNENKPSLKIAENKSLQNTSNECSLAYFRYLIYGNGYVDVGGDEKEILLGETKYFGLKKKEIENEADEYEIVEIPTSYGSEPKWTNITLADGWEWEKDSDVWGSNPIEILETKSGIYWEDKWFDKSTNSNIDLNAGMIRLIGRYWEKGKEDTFKVKLKATNKAEILVKVVEPEKLLTKNQSPTYERARDVFNKVVNIDSLCIYYGGKYGILPQILKGQIFQESAKKDFGGSVGWGFAPSYRYEPYPDQEQFAIFNGEFSKNPFYITATTDVEPPEHQHVEIIPYFSGDTITVWQVVKEHSQLVEDGSTPETRIYGTRTRSDTMNYNAYPKIREKYRELFDGSLKYSKKDAVGNDINLSFAERADTTNKLMIKYLRDEFSFKNIKQTKGMKNMVAQTRILASYGYFQAMYTTAILKEWGYNNDEDHLPENINKNDIIFPLAVKRYNSILLERLPNALGHNWSAGFETTTKNYVFKKWNTHKKYPNSTIDNMEKFLPQK